jgi:hypothetical protein
MTSEDFVRLMEESVTEAREKWHGEPVSFRILWASVTEPPIPHREYPFIQKRATVETEIRTASPDADTSISTSFDLWVYENGDWYRAAPK